MKNGIEKAYAANCVSCKNLYFSPINIGVTKLKVRANMGISSRYLKLKNDDEKIKTTVKVSCKISKKFFHLLILK